jgi:phosphatidylglycerophosphatase A
MIPGAGPGTGLRGSSTGTNVIRTDARGGLAARLIATWFGVGLTPVAPGTCASIAALPLAWMIRAATGPAGLGTAVALVFLAGCWAAGVIAKQHDEPDPAEIVVDEVAGQWLVLLVVPFEPIAWALGLLLFRLFDIWKPWPVSWADRQVKGGLGIMLDDVLAAGYAVLVLEVLRTVGGAVGVRS